MRLNRLIPQLTTVLFTLVYGWPVTAANLGVSPLGLELPPDGRPEVVRLRNPADVATLVKIEAVAWAEIGDLDDAPPAAEILVVPPVVKLEPHADQIVRVAMRQPLEASVEQAYRLLITEVPTQAGPEQTGLSFAVRMNLPVFVAPRGAAPDPVWTIRETPDGAAELVLRNEGRAHLRLTKLVLAEPGAAVPLLAVDQGLFALPGKEHSWRLEKPIYALPQSLEVRAETKRGELVMPVIHVRD